MSLSGMTACERSGMDGQERTDTVIQEKLTWHCSSSGEGQVCPS